MSVWVRGVWCVDFDCVYVFFRSHSTRQPEKKKVRHGSFVPSSYIIRCLWLIHFISVHIHNDIVIIYNARFCTPFSTGQFEIILLSFIFFSLLRFKCAALRERARTLFFSWYSIGFRLRYWNSSGRLTVWTWVHNFYGRFSRIFRLYEFVYVFFCSIRSLCLSL